ncbi:hypothetical protein JCM5350_000552 [Sporobolomyces pararoseus]
MTEQIMSKMSGPEAEVDDVVVMEQDEASSSTRHHTSASSSTAASSSFPSSSTRRSARTTGAPSGGSRRPGGGNRGNFNEMERQTGRGSRNEDGRQGTEQNIWDKVLDKNGGYQGMLTFDPFQEILDSHSRRSPELTQQGNALAAASLASPSA